MSRAEDRSQFERRRRGRNLALLGLLVAIVLLLYFLPFARMAAQ